MKSNRMFGILSILLDKRQITAKELAEYFEVSVRTIHRDLLDLSSAGFPIITQQGIGGGISLMPDFKYNMFRSHLFSGRLLSISCFLKNSSFVVMKAEMQSRYFRFNIFCPRLFWVNR